MGYDLAGEQGAVWAIIAAILILLPGIDRSMSASGVLIVATLLGASVGTVAALRIGGKAAALPAGSAQRATSPLPLGPRSPIGMALFWNVQPC